MHWRTVFDIEDVNHLSHSGGSDAQVADFFLFPLILLVLIIYAIRKHSVSNAAERKRLNTKGSIFMLSFIFVVLCTLLFVAYGAHKGVNNKLLDSYNGDHCNVTEGTVEHFMPYLPHVHGETFMVNNNKFEYSQYDETNPGFRTTREQGGPIKDGLHVKIWFLSRNSFGGYFNTHLGNMIARLDIADDNNISGKNR